MAVNNMTKEQAYQLIAAIHAQATGTAALTPTDLSSFISVAQSTLAAGYEQTLNAITQVLQKTLVAVRPYDEKFKGLEMTAEQWGGIIRKINFADTPAEADPTHATVNGQAIDQYIVKKPVVLETRYVGSDVWMGSYTIYREQLKTAFENESNFGAFMTGLMTHFLNERSQWFEGLKRSLLANMIAAKSDIGGGSVIHAAGKLQSLHGMVLCKDQRSLKTDDGEIPALPADHHRIPDLQTYPCQRSARLYGCQLPGSYGCACSG